MTANELRIGNFAKTTLSRHRGVPINILAIQDGKVSNYIMADGSPIWILIENIKPIPLTPEIVGKCGFVESEEDWLSLVLYNGITIYYNLAYRQISIVSSTDEWQQGSILEQIKALHQLQNLYFALTGEELTVNL